MTLFERWRRLPRWTVRLPVILVLLAIVFRLALPYVIQAAANWQLARVEGYGGRVGHVSLGFLRGDISIRNIKILKTGHGVPIFSARRLDVSLLWGHVLRGKVVGDVLIDAPQVTYVAPPVTIPRRAGKGKQEDPREAFRQLLPFRLNRVQIEHGRIHFMNHYSVPPVDLSVDKVRVVATNLSNISDLKIRLPAGVYATGATLGDGGFEVQMQMNPLMNQPTLQLTAQLTNLNLVALNDLLRAYGKVDVTRGTFGLYASFAAAEGNYDGYTKVFFSDLEVFNWQQDRKKNIAEMFWSAIVGTVTDVLSNQPKDQLAAKIPISGSFGTTDIDVWTAAGTLLENAFVRGLVPKLDEQINVRGVQE